MKKYRAAKETYEIARNLEKKAERLKLKEHIEEGDRRERQDYARDYARILYSSSFRRLQGKMQLLGISHSQFFRNRLTHSLEVAQTSRSIALFLGLKYPVVTEAAAESRCVSVGSTCEPR